MEAPRAGFALLWVLLVVPVPVPVAGGAAVVAVVVVVVEAGAVVVDWVVGLLNRLDPAAGAVVLGAEVLDVGVEAEVAPVHQRGP